MTVENPGGAITHTPLETGAIYCDDNLSLLARTASESVDLIYLDPPFFSNRTYEVIWGDEAELRSFEDRWEGGVNLYVEWMRDRVMELHRVLKKTGSLYLHCDWHAAHYLKVMLDDVFLESQFQNEIAWCYRGGGLSKRRWARKHDTIFFYTKGKKWTFNPQYTPYSESTVEVTGKTGRRVNKTEIDLDRGAHMPDWWTDINSLQTWSPERIGYPTQKPLALLKRIIEASSNPGDTVLDPFCGCGTTLQAAHQLKRNWIGIDISPTAVEVMRKQLARMGISPKIYGLPATVEQLRALKPFEFQNWVIQRVSGTHSPRRTGDMGIDGFSFLQHHPIQVKQTERVGREVVDTFQTAVKRIGRKKGYIIAFGFTRGAKEEAARVRGKESLEIELVTVQQILDDPTVITPRTGLFERDEPPVPRPMDTLPSVDDLIASEESN